MNNSVLETFVQYLPMLRTAAGLNQSDLGHMLGISKTAVSNIEHYKTAITIPMYVAMRMIFLHLCNEKHGADLVTPHIFELVDSKLTGKYSDWFNAIVNRW